MAHKALKAHTSTRAEIEVRGHLVRLVRLVRTFLHRNSAPFFFLGQGREPASPRLQVGPPRTISSTRQTINVVRRVRGQQFTKFDHLDQTKDLGPGGPHQIDVSRRQNEWGKN